MFCSRCGFQNEPGAVFCTKCGASVQHDEQPQAPLQNDGSHQDNATRSGFPPAAASALPAKKKRTGLIIGLAAGGLLLVGAALAAVLLLGGPGLAGTWSCEERGWVLQIEDGILTEYSPAGTDTTRFSYDGSEGEAELQDGDVSFTAKGDSLRLTDEETGEKYLFRRQEEDFEIEEAVLDGMEGLWSSEALGEVIGLDGGVLYVYAGNGDLTGSYDYDVRQGKGTLSLEGKEYDFSAGWDALNVVDIGTYVRAENGLDVASFVSRYANPLLATWYETTGTYGTIIFAADGSFVLEVYGKTFSGTYTYDTQTGSGSALLELTGEPEPFTYADGTLTLDGMAYTQSYVEQPTAEDINTAVTGIWYDEELPEELLIFYADGTVEVSSADTFYSGTYTFDPFEMNGVITLTDGVQSEEYPFSLAGDTLDLGGYTYKRQQTAGETGTILGTWYDVAGMQGTLYFDKDGLAIMESYGTFFYGTYVFDTGTGTGTMTLDFVEGPNTWNLILQNGLLDTGDAVYTQELVEQTTSTDAG